MWPYLCMKIIKKDILIVAKGPTQVLDDATMTAEAEYSSDFSKQGKKLCLSLHYNGVIYLSYVVRIIRVIYLLLVLKFTN